MSWVIRGYDEAETLATEVTIDDALRDWFRRELAIGEDDPMFDSYPLSTAFVSSFLGGLGIVIDKNQEYFLDYDA